MAAFLLTAWHRALLGVSALMVITFLVLQFGVGDIPMLGPASHQPKLVRPETVAWTPSYPPEDAQLNSSSSTSSLPSWDFVVERDGDNYGLTDEQCDIAFPKLYTELEKSVAGRQGEKISWDEFNARELGDGMVRGLIFEGELYILDFQKQPVTFTRAKATLAAINRALEAAPDRRGIPNVEFIFTTEDYDEGPELLWGYSKLEEDDWAWLMPDFAYWSWPEVKVGSYKNVRRRIRNVDEDMVVNGALHPGMRFQDKTKQLLWRGNVKTEPEIRGALLNASRGMSWANVRELNWGSPEELKKNLIPIEDHCKYMFLAHTEGRSFSGRGKYLQNCRSVFVSHKLSWKEAHHGALVSSGPLANYVEVESDWSNLEQKMNYLIDNPEVAETIAENSIKTFRDRYLTPAAEACYWRRLFREWAELCDFEPTFFTDSTGAKTRGISYESFMLTNGTWADGWI